MGNSLFFNIDFLIRQIKIITGAGDGISDIDFLIRQIKIITGAGDGISGTFMLCRSGA